MEFSTMCDRAAQIRALYHQLEERHYGRAWNVEELMLGFVGDVGDLAKLVQAESGVRQIPGAREKLAHELADCLWSVMSLARACDIDLEDAFLKTMDDLENHVQSL